MRIIILLSLIVILGTSYVDAGTFDVVDMDLCDDSGYDFVDGDYVCAGSRKDISADTVDIEEVFTAHQTLEYDCSGTESFNVTYYHEPVLQTSDGYLYFERHWDHTGEFANECNSSSQHWYQLIGLVLDLNSLYSSYIETNFYSDVVGGSEYYAPVERFEPKSEVSVDDIDGDLKVYEPYSKKVEQYQERMFMSASGLIWKNQMNDSTDVSRSNQEVWVTSICDSYENQCEDLPEATDVYDYVRNDVDNLNYIPLSNGDETLGSGAQLNENMTAALEYHFTHTKTPIFMRTSIQWTYNLSGGQSSFRGYYYGFVLLGMESDGAGGYNYWVQYPGGDKRLWSESTLEERWGYSDWYFGFTANYAGISKSINEVNFEIISEDTGFNVPVDHENNEVILHEGADYRFNVTSGAWYYRTDNPDMTVDLDNDGAYDDILWFGQENSTSKVWNVNDMGVLASIEGYDQATIRVLQRGKSGYAEESYTLKFGSPRDYTVDRPSQVYNTTGYEYDINMTTEILYDTFTFQLHRPDGTIVYSDSVQYGEGLEARVHDSVFGMELFDEGDEFYVNTSGTEPYKGGAYKLNDSLPGRWVNYGLDWNPVVPSVCYVEQNCTFRDNSTFSYMGSAQVKDGTGTLVKRDTGFDEYSAYFSGSFLTVSWNESGTYPFRGFRFNLSYSEVYHSTGTETLELCLSTQLLDEVCRTYNITVEETFGGGGGNGGAKSEDGDLTCDFEIGFNISNQGNCMQELYNLYWVDMDEDKVWESIPNVSYEYEPDPDCTNSTCDVTLNRSDLHDDDYCSGDQLVTDQSSLTESARLYACYDTAGYNEGNCSVYPDISITEWIRYMGFEVGDCDEETDIKLYDPADEIPDFYDYSHNICQEGYLLDELVYPGDRTSGYFCYPVEDVDMECQYDCSEHDFDGDGVNACDDVCCGGDDTIDDDGDGAPDDCDVCPFDPNDDVDNDGICANNDTCNETYNPNQIDSDNDGEGDACDDTPLGGDDDDGGDGGDGEVEPDKGLCSNGLLDEHIGETMVDYGGFCGTCDDGELSPLIGETAPDYGGKLCGRCDPDANTPVEDAAWRAIPESERSVPFEESLCQRGEAGIMMMTFVSVIVLLLLLFVLLLIVALVGWWYLRWYRYFRRLTWKSKFLYLVGALRKRSKKKEEKRRGGIRKGGKIYYEKHKYK